MSSFRHLLGQSHKTNQKDLHIRCLKSFGFVVNEKSRTMETQWQNVCWKCEQKYSKYILHNLLAQSANQSISPINQFGHSRLRNKHRATLTLGYAYNFLSFFQELRSLLNEKFKLFVTLWDRVSYIQGDLCQMFQGLRLFQTRVIGQNIWDIV